MKLLKKIFGNKPAQQQVKYKQKKRFTSFGNCQAHPIAQLLMANEHFNRYFEYVPFTKPVYMLTEQDLEKVTDLVSSVDLFIYQSVGEAFGKTYSTENLLSLTKDSCQRISFPSIYFNGYMPEINYLRYIGGEINAFSDYHDINLVNSYVRNPENCYQKTFAQYKSDDYYSSEELLNNAKKSVSTLREREQLCTIKVSDYIEKNWRDTRLFYSMNHPSNSVLDHLVSQVTPILGISLSNSPVGSELLGETVLPLYHSVQKLMSFDSHQGIKVRSQEMDLSNYLVDTLKVYASIPEKKLKHNLVHLEKEKMALASKFIDVV